MDPTALVPPNPVSSWKEYFDATRSMPLHPLFRELEPHLPRSGKSVDLGCGVGHAVLFMAEKGWEVDAVDGHQEALTTLSQRLGSNHRVHLHHSLLQDFEMKPNSYDLVVAAYSLFFLGQEDFKETWEHIRNALKPGGLFVGEFLGVKDDWADQFTAHSHDEVDELLAGWATIYSEEVEREGFVSQGQPKHWHIFHVIARKPDQI